MVDVFATIDMTLAIVSTRIDGEHRDESETEDCTAYPQALTIALVGSEGADCEGRERKAISKEKSRP
jgi:hypothetical protein